MWPETEREVKAGSPCRGVISPNKKIRLGHKRYVMSRLCVEGSF